MTTCMAATRPDRCAQPAAAPYWVPVHADGHDGCAVAEVTPTRCADHQPVLHMAADVRWLNDRCASGDWRALPVRQLLPALQLPGCPERVLVDVMEVWAGNRAVRKAVLANPSSTPEIRSWAALL